MRGLNGWIVKQTSREFVSWDLDHGGLWVQSRPGANYCFPDNNNPRSHASPTLDPRAPLHLNSHCAKLFCSDFHLPPLLPHPLTVLSPHPAPTPHTHLPHHRPCPPTLRPDPQTGTKTGSKMREPHPPTRCSQCPTLSYVTKDESEMPVIGWCTSSGDICIMAFIMMFYGSDNSVNT